MELLAVLVVAGLRDEVVVDDLDRPLDILELHLLLGIALAGNVLLAFPLAGRCAITVGLLLLLLTELLRELFDLPTLLGAVAPGVVHRVLWSDLIAAEGLARSLVTAWATTPTSRCCDNGSSGSACQGLVVVGLLLLPILVLATALSNDICFGLAGRPYYRSRLGVPCTPFCSPGAFVYQVEELGDVFHLVGGQLLKHLLIFHALSKSDNNRIIQDARHGVLILRELMDKGPQ
jgi:hypothetical protein